jgi:hypothetical protein
MNDAYDQRGLLMVRASCKRRERKDLRSKPRDMKSKSIDESDEEHASSEDANNGRSGRRVKVVNCEDKEA